MALDTSTLIALISSRVCHDIASPIQALTTALDVLEGDNGPEMRESAIGLIRDSTNQASAKVEFLRATFGSLTSGLGDANLVDLKNIATRFLATQKPELKWEIEAEYAPKSVARVIMHLIMIAHDSLPRGGEILVKQVQPNEYSIRASGLRVSLKPNMRTALQGLTPENGFDGRSIQPYMAYLTAIENKIELAAREDDESLTIIARVTH